MVTEARLKNETFISIQKANFNWFLKKLIMIFLDLIVIWELEKFELLSIDKII